MKGKVPVVAHVERYPEVQANPAAVEKLIQSDCYLLVNLSSLAGGWGRRAQSSARELLKRQLVHAVTTDLHSPRDAKEAAEGLVLLEEMVGAEQVQRLVHSAPATICGLARRAGDRESQS